MLVVVLLTGTAGCTETGGGSADRDSRVDDLGVADRGGPAPDRGVTAPEAGLPDAGKTGADFKTCMAACAKDSDCKDGLHQFVCVKGYCKNLGCTKDSDCQTSGNALNKCRKVSITATYSFKRCGPWCTSHTDCDTPGVCAKQLPGWSAKQCTWYCSTPTSPCPENDYCDTQLQRCVGKDEPCTDDADCKRQRGLDKCNKQTGRCECSSDQECLLGFATSMLTNHTWKCVKMPF